MDPSLIDSSALSDIPPDITFKFTKSDGGEIEANKTILALVSKVFRNMFFVHNTKDKLATEMVLEDTTKPPFQIMLNAIYNVKPMRESLQGKSVDEMFAVLYLDGRSLKQCCLFEDEVREGWNNFSTNVMLTEVASLMAGKTTKLSSCGECGLGHDRSSHCQKDGDHREELKTEPVSGNKGQTGGGGGGTSSRSRHKDLPEECLQCFRTHDSGKCYISEDLMCNFPECYRKGHLRVVHYPQKTDTIDRLFAKYSSNFPIIYPESGRKRENHGDSNRDIKRSRDDKDRSR